MRPWPPAPTVVPFATCRNSASTDVTNLVGAGLARDYPLPQAHKQVTNRSQKLCAQTGKLRHHLHGPIQGNTLSLKNRLMPHVARALSSQRLLEWRRKAFEWARKLTGRKHVLTFYFRPDDPYSYLMAQRLQEFVEHFRLQLKPVTLLYLDDSLYPARDMLDELAPEDAHRLARLHKLEFPDDWAMPDPKAITQAARLLIAHENDPMGYLRLARQSADAIWQGNLERIDYLSRHHDCETSDKAELTLQARREK